MKGRQVQQQLNPTVRNMQLRRFIYICDINAAKCSVKRMQVQLSPEEHFVNLK